MGGQLGASRTGSLRFAIVAGLSLALLFVGPQPVPAAPAPGPSGAKPPAGRSVPVGKVPVREATKGIAVGQKTEPAASWPAGGSVLAPVATTVVGATSVGTVDRRAAVGTVSAGGLPVSVRKALPGPVTGAPVRPDGLPRAELTVAPTSVRVSVADRAMTDALGIRGVVFRLERGDGIRAADRVALDVEYSAFREAYGGDYAGRLVLMSLPGCAWTAPTRPGCATATPLPSVRNVVTARTLSTDSVEVAGADSGGSVYAVMAVASGEGGTYSASDLRQQLSWASGRSGGDFAMAYPFKMPAGLGGPVPELALQYSAGSVDGMTFAANGQVSIVGEGWALPVGFIEQGFRPCTADGGATGDLCQLGDRVMSLAWGGRSGKLIKDTTTGVWKSTVDEGLRIELLTDVSAGNGDNEGEYWRITTLDGTQYFFGKHKRYPADPQVTNSVQQVPVFGNHAGEPCHGGWCQQAYRWNLDYVVDQRGNSMTYFWTRYRGRYGVQNNANATAPYDLSSVLARIEYGTRAGTEGLAAAPMKVQLDNAERCFAPCTNYFDTPLDQYCAESATSCPNTLSPVFFSKHRLEYVTTFVWHPTLATYKRVDSWWLQQGVMFSGDWIPPAGNDTPPNLWLSNIHHYGWIADDTYLEAPLLSFTGTLMANRVRWGASLGISPYAHARVTSITNGMGGETVVAYTGADCGANETFSDVNNNRRCFPQFTKPLQAPADWAWFHKYVVDQVTEKDLVGGGPDETWRYIYSWGGASTNVMWHWDGNESGAQQYRNWADWRGYPTVITVHGIAGQTQSLTSELFYRGMNGDKTYAGWNTRVATISDSFTANIPDHPALAGMVRESAVYDGFPGGVPGPIVKAQIHEPTVVQTGSRGPVAAGQETVIAYQARETRLSSRTAIEGGGWRNTTVDTAYDGYGLPTTISDWGEAGTGDDVCTRIEYARNLTGTNYLVDFRKHIEKTNCDTTPSGSDFLGVEWIQYDGSDTGQVTVGLPTKKLAVDAVAGSSPVSSEWRQVGRWEYDANGRVTKTYDGIDRATTTAYTPSSGGPVTQVAVTNPAGHVTTTVLDPLKGVPLTVTDANGKVTTSQYDKLGRLAKVWLPGRSTSLTGNIEFVYDTPGGAPASVATKKLGPNGNQIVSYQIFDGRLRPRQTQTPAPQANGGRVVVDTAYDGRGLTSKRSTFWNASAPSNALASFADTAVQHQQRFTYDGAARQTVDAQWAANALKWQTTTVHTGNTMTVTPPSGGTATKAFTDADGNTTALRQYLTASPTGTSYQTTSYVHDRLGRRTSVTDPSGNVWTTTYDLLGRTKATTDPDRGAVTNTYDAAGQLLTTLDARSVTLSYTYDSLGRKRTVWNGAVTTGTKLAEWTYDTLASGTVVKGQPATTIRFHASGQYRSEVTGYDDGYRPLGATVKIPVGQGGLTGDWTIGTTYKVDGSVASNSYPAAGGLAAETVNYTYDNSGLLLTVAGTDTYVSGTSYHAWGAVYQRILGTGTKRVSLTTAVDEATGRLTANKAETENQTTPNTWNYALTENYGYDDAGNVKSVNEVNAAGTTVSNQCLTYDQLRRLTEAWTTTAATCQATPTQGIVAGPDAYWTSYTYTPIGNRQVETKHAAGGNTVRTYTYPASGAAAVRPHAVTSVAITGAATGTDSYGYDNTGNTTTRNISGKPGQTLTWDEEGRLKTVVDSGGTTSYIYDANGSRLIEARPDGSGTAYLAGFELNRSAGGSATCTRYYTHGGDTVASRTTGGGLTWLASDHHGTGQLSIAATNLAVTRRKSDPFGNPRGTQPSWPTKRGFVNGTRDATGLTHLGAREYEPGTGRFISVDPLIDYLVPQKMHAYAYSGANPATYSDPGGTDFCDRNACPGDPGWQPNRVRPVPPPPPQRPCLLPMSNGMCFWRQGDPRPKQIRPGNMKNGANARALDTAQRNGAVCQMRTHQIYCFGVKRLYFRYFESDPSLHIVEEMPDGRPMTVGDVVFFSGSEQQWTDRLQKEEKRRAELRARNSDAFAKAYGPNVELHEAVHSDQWAKYESFNGYVADYAVASAASSLVCRSPAACNRFEVEANLYWGGYAQAPVFGRVPPKQAIGEASRQGFGPR